jgi:hypothetical protein
MIDQLIKAKQAERDELLQEWGEIFIDDLIKKALLLRQELIEKGLL